MKQRFTIEYEEPIYEMREVTPPGTGTYSVKVGTRRLRCDVEVDADLERIAKVLGKKACQSKGRKSQDGFVTVKQLGSPFKITKTEC